MFRRLVSRTSIPCVRNNHFISNYPNIRRLCGVTISCMTNIGVTICVVELFGVKRELDSVEKSQRELVKECTELQYTCAATNLQIQAIEKKLQIDTKQA